MSTSIARREGNEDVREESRTRGARRRARGGAAPPPGNPPEGPARAMVPVASGLVADLSSQRIGSKRGTRPSLLGSG